MLLRDTLRSAAETLPAGVARERLDAFTTLPLACVVVALGIGALLRILAVGSSRPVLALRALLYYSDNQLVRAKQALVRAHVQLERLREAQHDHVARLQPLARARVSAPGASMRSGQGRRPMNASPSTTSGTVASSHPQPPPARSRA